MLVLENAQIRIEIAEEGAELRSIRTADGAEWLWQGDPEWWAGRAPLLFPVVGQSPDGQVTVAGATHEMPPHGFARRSTFDLVSASTEGVELELLPDATTRAAFPFDFRLSVDFRLQGPSVEITALVENRADRPMPFQFGFHPAFRWPLPGAEGAGHRVRFPGGLPGSMLRLNADGLMDPASQPVPGEGDAIAMDPAHFQAGAMVFSGLGGKAFRFEGGSAAVDMETTGLPDFALWQKPGAPFLCLEPWQGTAPLPEHGKALETRSNVRTLEPGESARFGMRLRFHHPGA